MPEPKPGIDSTTTTWDVQRRKNRDKAREWRAAKAGSVSEEELQECIKDPPKAATVRGPNWVVCLECGQLCKVLREKRGHLEQHYGMTEERYVEKFGSNAPFVSAETSAALSRAGKRADRSPAWQSSAEARKGKALTVEHKRKLGESIGNAYRQKKVTSKIPLWPKIKGGLSGLSKGAVAEKIDGHLADIYRIQRSVGMVGWPPAYRHGEFLTRRHVVQFSTDTGLTEETACNFIKISYRTFTNLLKAKADRPMSSRDPSNPKSPHNGKLLNAAYDRVIDHVCFEDYKNRWRVRHFLQSEINEIPGKHAALTSVFEALGVTLRAGETSSNPDAVMEWLSWKTRAERGREPFRTALFLGLVLEEFLKEKPTLLQPDKFRPGTLASELLAKDYKTKPGRIDEVIDGKHQAIAPTSIRIALGKILPPNTGGAPKGLRPLTKLRVKLVAAAAIGRLIEQKKEISPDLFPEVEDARDQEQRTRGFRSEYRLAIEAETRSIAENEAPRIYSETKREIATLTKKKGLKKKRT